MASPPTGWCWQGGAEHYEFLRGYDEIDIALDTFPYNGGTTTTEALWQGVPVLTFNGDRWASRTSRSLLLAADCGLGCDGRVQDFVSRAINLAQSETPLACWLAPAVEMRQRLGASTACDSGTFAAPSRGFTGITRI